MNSRLPGIADTRTSVLAAIALIFTTVTALGAEFRRIPDRTPKADGVTCELFVSGKIEPDDTVKLLKALGDRHGGKGDAVETCLDSDGGNFEEALELADLFIRRGLATNIEAGRKCLSACAILFMTGMRYSTGGSEIARSLHVEGKLGFHAPQPRIPAGATIDADDVVSAYAAAIEGVGQKLLKLSRIRGRSWDDQLFKPSLLNEMMMVQGPRNYYYIDTTRKAFEYEIRLEGVAPYAGFDIDDARSACENAIARGGGAVLANWFFQNDIERINKKRLKDHSVITLDVRRIKDTYCTVTRSAEENSVSVRYNTSGGERTDGGGSWMLLPKDTPISSLGVGRFNGPIHLRAAWCTGAKAGAEATICASRELSRLDRELAGNYDKALSRLSGAARTSVIEKQRQWLAERNRCGADYICINRQYVAHVVDSETKGGR
jgi:Lysozyme inhibitor LprI